ncbi:MAG TPA: GvpL/GvpF family gas vesicle protein [Conexibacter sp.]|jgi:hypothetical protein
MIWLYGICDQPAEALPLPAAGVAGAEPRAVVEGPLTAVVSDHEHDLREPAAESMIAHARVVEQLAGGDAGGVLPARFGSSLETEQAVHELLRDRRERFLARLACVHGRVEVGVRAMRLGAAEPEHAEAARSSGRDYLLAKLRERGEAGRLADELDRRLTALSRERRLLLLRQPRELLRAAYLVEPSAVEAVQREVARSEQRSDELAVLCTGPWPPYSFVEEER